MQQYDPEQEQIAGNHSRPGVPNRPVSCGRSGQLHLLFEVGPSLTRSGKPISDFEKEFLTSRPVAESGDPIVRNTFVTHRCTGQSTGDGPRRIGVAPTVQHGGQGRLEVTEVAVPAIHHDRNGVVDVARDAAGNALTL